MKHCYSVFLCIGLDDRSDNSGPGSRNNSSPSSANNSATNSLRGSASNSPCASPQPSSPSKWPDKEQENAVTHACRYFVMKCNNHRNLDVSINKQIWCTSPSNEKRLNKLFKVRKNPSLPEFNGISQIHYSKALG